MFYIYGGIIFWIVVALLVSLFLRGAKGCSGDCEQGRNACNCRRDQ